MRNYSTLTNKMEEYFKSFASNLTRGFNKIHSKFIIDMANGINQNNSVILSEISRARSEKVNIKKNVERIERHLDAFEDTYSSRLEENYTNMIKPYINNKKLYFVDGSDIVKNQYTKFENKGCVLDGSKEHSKAFGYNLYDIATIDNANQPLSLVSELFSSKDEDYDSTTLRWMDYIKRVVDNYGAGTIIADRGFDSAILYEKILQLGCNFIVRVNQRDICYIDGQRNSIQNIVAKTKGKYAIKRKIKGKNYDLKVSYKQITINSNDAKTIKNKVLTLVIVKGYSDYTNNAFKDSALVLLTSKIVVGKNEVIDVVNNYTSRWKIEEFFRYKKQQFKLENIRVRKYRRIKALNRILTISMFLSNYINMKDIGKTISKQKKQIKKYVAFKLYRISDGIKKIFNVFSDEIMSHFYPPRIPRTRNLWTVMRVKYKS